MPGILLLHLRNHLLRHVEEAGDVGIHHQVVVFFGVVGERLRHIDSSIVNQQINTAEMFEGCVYHLDGGFFLAVAEFMKKGKIDGNARNAWWAKFTGLPSLLSAIFFIVVGAPHADAEKFTSGTEQAPLTPTLMTGDYVWKPAASPAGPVVIIVSIQEQTLYVYRNGVRIGRSTVSTGKSGHRTPTGVFTILQKNEKHTSSIYKGASTSYAYAALAITLPDGSRQWQALGSASGSPAPDLKALEKRLVIPQSFLVQARAVVSSGTTLIVTDQPVNGTTQSGSNFNILTTSTTSSTNRTK